MKQEQARAFLAKADVALHQSEGDEVPDRYASLLESHLHELDCQRTTIAQSPCDLNLVPAPSIRGAVGPVGYRHFFFGLAEHFWQIRGLCGFRGDQHLLDVGCGFGKTALSLRRLIRPPGSYTGFDIQPHLIEFTQRLFGQLGLTDTFRTDCFPIAGNQYYRGAGEGTRPEDFVFPYNDNHFHCAVAFSVFTHLRSAALANYARNLARVLRPGGILLLSFYLLDNSPEGDPAGAPWTSSARRKSLTEAPEPVDPEDRGRLKVLLPHIPEYLVAYRLGYVLDVFREVGCYPQGGPLFGSWSGRSDFYGHQDCLIFRKGP
jgi:SAM-dependent methyltransferase